MRVTAVLIGDKKLQAKLTSTGISLIAAAQIAALDEANAIMEESLLEVPMDTGSLGASTFIEQTPNGSVNFGYGGGYTQINPKTGESTEDYMLYVHERMDVVHPNGKAKFLEDPLNRHKNAMESTLIRRIRDIFKF